MTQLGKLGKIEARRITDFLRNRLALQDAARKTGHTLVGPHFGAYWRYRVRDYRLICEIQDDALRILGIEVGNQHQVDL